METRSDDWKTFILRTLDLFAHFVSFQSVLLAFHLLVENFICNVLIPLLYGSYRWIDPDVFGKKTVISAYLRFFITERIKKCQQSSSYLEAEKIWIQDVVYNMT